MAVSTYDPKYCELLRDFVDSHLATKPDEVSQYGMLTRTKIAKGIGLKRDTFYRWLKDHAEFKEAFDEAWPDVVDSWVNLGTWGMAGLIKGFNATTYCYLTKVICGWQSDDAGTKNVINIENLNYLNAVKQLSPDELEARISLELQKRLPNLTNNEESP